MAKDQKKTYTYPIDYFITLDGKRGKKRVHITAHSKAEELQKLEQKKRELDAGQYGTGKITVREWADRWYADNIKPRKMTEKSRSMYPTIINKWILPVIGDIPLERLTAYDCQLVINAMSAQSKTYQQKARAILQAIVRSAYNAERIDRDVSVDIKVPRSAETKIHRRALTPEERDAVERVCLQETLRNGHKNESGALYLTMLYCGLRPGECCALRKSDIDFTTNTIHVRQARECGSDTIKAPKTESGVRDVPMTPEYAEWLNRWILAHPTAEDCPFVFTQRDHKTIITDSSLQRRWGSYKQHLARELGGAEIVTKPGRKHKITYDTSVVTIDPYCLRHSYATELILAGVDRWDIARYMGHSNPSVVEETYGHPEDLLDKASRQKLERHRQEYKAAHPGGIDPRDLARWGMGEGSVERVKMLFTGSKTEQPRKTYTLKNKEGG